MACKEWEGIITLHFHICRRLSALLQITTQTMSLYNSSCPLDTACVFFVTLVAFSFSSSTFVHSRVFLVICYLMICCKQNGNGNGREWE